MQLTTDNLDQRLEDTGLMLLARVMADGRPHRHQLRRTDTVDYVTTTTYNTAEDVMNDIENMQRNAVALIHKYPNRPTAKFVVKYGEVL